MVEATEVVAHLQALRRSGVGTRHISTASGVSRSAVSHLLRSATTCRAGTASALLGVTSERSGRALVDAAATNRAVAALRERGWTLGAIAHSVGRSRIRPDARQVTADTERRVRRLARSAGCPL